ncbi:MAG TPA: DUF2071 domain-containing protein [Candidatus Acidoferrum sp.]|nr:DUF2071 domain-containing protein [Candidatus Acidoferrum sp.]
MNSLLSAFHHRPWPLPPGRWIMAQSWHDLLFAHWPLSPESLRPAVPSPLEIDTFSGQAWISVVPFRMTGVRLRGFPPLPWISSFPELNVRTYVVADGKPGVWFFSLDAANPLAVAAARAWFHLPYFRADMACEQRAGWIEYRSTRTDRSAPPASLSAKYQPLGPPFSPRPGTLNHFLTERYCLYAEDSRRQIHRGEIHHPPWSLNLAQAEFPHNDMALASGLNLPAQQPLLHFARRQDVLIWPLRRVAS